MDDSDWTPVTKCTIFPTISVIGWEIISLGKLPVT